MSAAGLGQHHVGGSASQETDPRIPGDRPFVVIAWTADIPDGNLSVPGPPPDNNVSRTAVLAESTSSDRVVFPGEGAYPLGDVGGPVAADAAGQFDGGLDVDAEQAGQVRG
jgi:hypothetical protein